jgi:hypothetical protein
MLIWGGSLFYFLGACRRLFLLFGSPCCCLLLPKFALPLPRTICVISLLCMFIFSWEMLLKGFAFVFYSNVISQVSLVNSCVVVPTHNEWEINIQCHRRQSDRPQCMAPIKKRRSRTWGGPWCVGDDIRSVTRFTKAVRRMHAPRLQYPVLQQPDVTRLGS